MTQRTTTTATLLAALLLLTLGCERRPLEELFFETAKFHIKIDWSKTKLDPDTDPDNLYRASAWLFATDGTAPFAGGKSYKEYRLDSPRGGEIDVPVGRYSVLVFNNSTSEFSSNVSFRNTADFGSFEYFANAATTTRSTTTPDEDNYILEPDKLGAWSSTTLRVTPAMVILSQGLEYPITDSERVEALRDLKQLENVQPELLTPALRLTVYVKNIASATVAEGKFIGMAHSVQLADTTRSASGASHLFHLANRIYDTKAPKSGTIQAQFNTLGMLDRKDARYYVELRFTLTEELDGSKLYPAPPAPPFRFDITDQMQKFRYHHEIEIFLGFKPDENIELPDLHVSGGLEPDIGDWGEEEEIPIPSN